MIALLVLWFAPALLVFAPALCSAYDALCSTYRWLRCQRPTISLWLVHASPMPIAMQANDAWQTATCRVALAYRTMRRRVHRAMHPNLYIRLAYLTLV